MKYFLVIFISILLLILNGCTSNVIVSPVDNSSGSLLLKIDPTNAPQNVSTVVATLSRAGYSNKVITMSLLSDSTASALFSGVPVGQWHLKVDAKESNGQIVYSGETDIIVEDGIQKQVNLVLNPVSNGTGSISIFVSWNQPVNTSGWIDFAQNPVLLKGNTPYDANGISHPVILHDTVYKMWYNCMASDGKSYTFYATSPNGITWTKMNTPVLSPSNDNDYYGTTVHSVLKIGNTYKLYYTGRSITGSYRIFYASSINGINWEKRTDPVLSTGTGWENNISIGEVVFYNDFYYMFYNGISSDNNTYSIGVAKSTDGIYFTRHTGNPVLTKTAAWEQKGPNTPSVIYDQGEFKMVYQNSEGNGLSFGMAVSNDGLNWTKQNTNPFFGCPFTANKWASAYAAYPCFRRIGSDYVIYYSGSNFFDQKTAKIGFAKKPI